jgi:hypothetical protein
MFLVCLIVTVLVGILAWVAMTAPNAKPLAAAPQTRGLVGMGFARTKFALTAVIVVYPPMRPRRKGEPAGRWGLTADKLTQSMIFSARPFVEARRVCRSLERIQRRSDLAVLASREMAISRRDGD